MRISVVNLTHGLLPDTEVLTAIRAINRQIAEDFAPYWNLSGVLRLEGNTGGAPREENAEELQGEGILYLWDKANVPNAIGYHEANYRGIPYGFVFVDVAREMDENWTVTLSHEALELIGDRQAHLLVRGPDPRDRRRRVYYWHEMCDAVQDESYEIDGVEVSNFVLPLYFTPDAEPGSRNDFLGTRYRMRRARDDTSLASFGINPGGYVGFYDPAIRDHVTVLGPDREETDEGVVDPDSSRRAGHRRRRKNKARMARRGNRYQEMGEAPIGGEREIRPNVPVTLASGGVELAIRSPRAALRVVVDIPPLASARHQGRGYFAHDIYSDARKVHDDLAEAGFEELTALEIQGQAEDGASGRPEAEIRVGHGEGDALLARLRPAYRQIVGFDHWTVARSILENAEALLELLPNRCTIDIVCHSRGAGVARCLLEHPKLAGRLGKRGIRVGKVVFVAGACQGSPLAGPEHLVRLLGAFSSLRSVGGEYFPLAVPLALLRAAQYGLRVFPGIASMAPGSPIIRQLNRPIDQKGCEYITMRSDYEPRAVIKEMLDEVWIDRLVFRGAANDGVVPFDGAARFDAHVRKTLRVVAGPEFGGGGREGVYHTAFFEQREVRAALLEHLLPAP